MNNDRAPSLRTPPSPPVRSSTNIIPGTIDENHRQVRANTINELQRSSYYRGVFWVTLIATLVEFVAVITSIGLSYKTWQYSCTRWIGAGMILIAVAGYLSAISLIYHYRHPLEINVIGQVVEPVEGTPRRMYKVKEASAFFFFIGYLTVLISVISNSNCSERSPILFWTAVAVLLYNVFIYCIPLTLLLLAIFCLPCLIIFLRWMHPPPNRGAPEDIIHKLPSFKYSDDPDATLYGDVIIEPADATCAICLQPYEREGEIRVLSCRHHFHQSCVDEWFRIQATCPLCVKPIVETPPPAVDSPEDMV